MRLLLIQVALTLGLLHSLAAESRAQYVTIHQKQIQFYDLMVSIRQQTGYDFLVLDKQLTEQAKAKDLSVNTQPLVKVLETYTAGQAFTYEIDVASKTIIFKQRDASATTDQSSGKSALILAYTEVRGRVVDTLGDPLPGASVRVINADGQRTTLQTATDRNGEFILKNVPEDAVLKITYVGYGTREVSATAIMVEGTIVLRADASAIQDVEINAGYYTVKDRERTGSISRVSSEVIQNQPVSNPLGALIGRMPGVNIIQSTGVPGGGFGVEIRGRNSITGTTQPLYIIDGVPFSNQGMGSFEVGFILGGASPSGGLSNTGLSPMVGINPSDIESIEVLKDADATAIYGSRGANGVVLITTRRYKKNQSQFTVRYTQGMGKMISRYDLMNTQEYLEIRREAYKNDGIPIPATAYDVNGTWDQNRYTDWQEVLVGGTAIQNNLQLSIQGGSELTNYLLTGSSYKETTVFPGDYANRKLAARSVVNHRSADNRFQASANVAFTIDKNNFPGVDLNYYAIRLAPNAPALYNADGSLNWGNNTWDNPLAQIEQDYRSKYDNLSMNLTLSQEVFEGLSLSMRGGINYGWMDEDRTRPYTMVNPSYGFGPESSSIALSSTKRQSWIIEPQLTYQKSWSSGLALNALLGTTFQMDVDQFLEQSAGGFTSNSLIYDIKSASRHTIVANRESEYKYAALFGRVNVGWQNRYFINLTGRRDGSSRFGPGNQFANFGAIGAAWIFSDEAFAKNHLGFLSYGKLRGSYGLTGSDNIGDYKYLDTYSSSTAKYEGKIGLAPSGLFNPNFAWETNSKLEGSLELGFFENRLSVVGSYYSNRSSNQLVGVPLPAITGFPSIHANLGATVQNTGFELELHTKNIVSKRLEWTSLFTLTLPRNKLVSFPDLEKSTYATQYVIGHPLNISKRYNFLGVDPQTGLYQYQDVNQDGRLTVDDRQTIVHLNPKFYGGLNNSFTFGDFQLDIFFQFVKQNGRNFRYTFGGVPGMASNAPREILDRWQQIGDQSEIQRMTTGADPQAITAFSSLWYSTALLSDVSFLRLKNLNLAYKIPAQWVRGVSGSVFVQGQNLWTLTNYKGADPEANATFNASIAPLRMWTGGVQLNF